MINSKKLSIAALVLLVAGAIGSILTFNISTKSVSVAEERVIDNNTFTAIEISADNERIEIISSEDQTTKIELSGKSTEDMEDYLTVDVRGNKLIVQLKDRKVFKFFDFNDRSLTLTVYLPEKVYKSLEVEVDNGSVYADQLNIKDVNAETNNGHIEMEDIAAAKVNVESDNGEIVLENVEGEIIGETNNGEIQLDTTNLDRPITLECDNGTIEINAEKEPSNATFNVHVDNGDINIFDKYSGNAVFGNGENVISLTTNNGEIVVTK